MVKYGFASNYAVPVNLNASDFWTSAIKKQSKEKKKRNKNVRSMDMDIAKDETLTNEKEFKEKRRQEQ